MEFHNVKLLPKGLPEIIAQLVPYDIYPDTKVVVYPRKDRRGILGSAGSDDLLHSYEIRLYPTVITLHRGTEGTYSFSLWADFLKVALHEIGHLAVRSLYEHLLYGTGLFGIKIYSPEVHYYVEQLADNWMNQALARILQVDSWLGQPPRALTGYPGIQAYRFRNNGGRPWDGFNPHRIAEWRGLRCGGQVTLGVVASQTMSHLLGPTWKMEDKSRARLERIARDQVHRATNNLGIQRYAFSANGRRYLMFNVGEAEAVYEWLVANKSVLVDAYRMLNLQQQQPVEPKYWQWEPVDGTWELVGIDTPSLVPPEQMRLLL